MGGAVVTHVASQGLLKNILGLVVIDVVEGSALDALSSMHSLIESRPKQFGDIEDAIEWR
jgi:protein phosphatase methylesterase 1